MRKLKQHTALLLLACATLFLADSCNKSDTSTAPITSPNLLVHTVPNTVYNSIDSAGTPLPGVVLSSPFNLKVTAEIDSPGLLMMMNQDGQILKELATPGFAFDFNRWTINGQVRYTYLVNSPSALHYMGQDQFEGYAVIADSNLNTLQQVDFTPIGNSVYSQTGQGLDVHEFILVSDNDYITESLIMKPVSNIPSYVPHTDSAWVAAPLIEEVSNGVVLWSWDGSVDTSFYANSVTGNVFTNKDTAQDYIHLNSITIDPRDNNLIVSMRSQCQIIKLNRQTGAVMWRLGGKNSDFPLTSNQVFLFQHHASLADNNQTLLLFDDGDPIKRAYSRVDEFRLDETNKVVTSFSSYNIPEAFTSIMGSVQKNGNEYFIGGGSANYILEVNYVTGQKIMELKSSQYASYRSFKY